MLYKYPQVHDKEYNSERKTGTTSSYQEDHSQ
jgi:hypothetical protein